MPNPFNFSFTAPDGTVTAVSGELSSLTCTVTPPPPPPAPQPAAIPAGAVAVNMLTAALVGNHDAGTSGTSTGSTSYPVTAPDGTKNCRLFDFTNSGGGGFIYHARALADATPYTNFCYRLEEYSDDWSNVTCSEMDLERTDANGHPLDMATQLDGYHGVVDVTIGGKWQGTSIKADPSARPAKSWHSVDVYVKENPDGTVTYVGITLDGVYCPIGVTGQNRNMNTVWGKNILNVQRQFDSKAAGPVRSQVYTRRFDVVCW